MKINTIRQLTITKKEQEACKIVDALISQFSDEITDDSIEIVEFISDIAMELQHSCSTKINYEYED